MADKSHILTDEKLEEMEKRLSAIYSRAEKEIQKTADEYFSKFAKQDESTANCRKCIPLTTILCKGNSHSIVCQYSDGIGIREILLEDGILSVGQIYGTNSNISDSYLIPKALYKLVIE